MPKDTARQDPTLVAFEAPCADRSCLRHRCPVRASAKSSAVRQAMLRQLWQILVLCKCCDVQITLLEFRLFVAGYAASPAQASRKRVSGSLTLGASQHIAPRACQGIRDGTMAGAEMRCQSTFSHQKAGCYSSIHLSSTPPSDMSTFYQHTDALAVHMPEDLACDEAAGSRLHTSRLLHGRLLENPGASDNSSSRDLNRP